MTPGSPCGEKAIPTEAERGKCAFPELMRLPPSDCTPAAVTLLDFVFARVWQRPALSRRDRRFIALPCVAVADAETPLRDHVCAALGSGDVTVIEIRDAAVHFAVYAGWPKAPRLNMAVDEQWKRIHRGARTAVTADHAQRPGGPPGGR